MSNPGGATQLGGRAVQPRGNADGNIVRKAVDESVDRAPGTVDLSAHGLQSVAGARLRELGRPVPEAVMREEQFAAISALAVPALLQRARAAYDGRLMIMKGAEVALYHRDPALRPYGDVDLLADDADRAQRALLAAGFREVGSPEDEDVGYHLCPLAWPGLPICIELHRRPHWAKGLPQPPVQEIFDAAEPSGLGIEGILAPARHHHALLLAGHSWTHEPLQRLIDLIDIAAVTHGTDRTDVRKLARRWAVSAWAHDRAGGDGALGRGRAVSRAADLGSPPVRRARADDPRDARPALRRTGLGAAGANRSAGVARRGRLAPSASRRRAVADEAHPHEQARAQRVASQIRASTARTNLHGRIGLTLLTLRTDDLYWREIDDEIVVLEGRGSTYLSVNNSGALLWRMLAHGATRDEVIAALLTAYQLDAVTAAADADRFLDQMHAAGLLAA